MAKETQIQNRSYQLFSKLLIADLVPQIHPAYARMLNELVSKRIESLSVETRKQCSYTKKYEKRKNHIDLQIKNQLASKVGDKDIKELSHIVHMEYATNEIVRKR
jgi:hypothetical protein